MRATRPLLFPAALAFSPCGRRYCTGAAPKGAPSANAACSILLGQRVHSHPSPSLIPTPPANWSNRRPAAPLALQHILGSQGNSTPQDGKAPLPNLSNKTLAEGQSTDEKVDKRVMPIAISTLVTGLAVGAVVPAMPIFVLEMGISPFIFGFIVSAMGLARLLANVPSTVFADRFGRKPIMVFGWAGSALSMALLGAANSAITMAAARFLAGLCTSAQNTGAQMYLTDISSIRNRARTFAPLAVGWQAGAMIGPAIGGVLTDIWGFRSAFYFCSGALFLVAAVNSYILPETCKGQKHPPMVRDAAWTSLLAWRPMLKNCNLRAVMAVATTSWFASVGAQFTLLPLFACSHFQMSAATVGAIFAAQALVNVIGCQPIAALSDRYGRKLPIVVGLILVAGSTGLLPLAGTAIQFAFLASVPLGIGNAMLSTAPIAYVTDNTTEENRGAALALFRTAQDIGFLLGGVTLCSLAQVTSVATAMCATGAGVLGVAVYFATCAKEVLAVQPTPVAIRQPFLTLSTTAVKSFMRLIK